MWTSREAAAEPGQGSRAEWQEALGHVAWEGSEMRSRAKGPG